MTTASPVPSRRARPAPRAGHSAAATALVRRRASSSSLHVRQHVLPQRQHVLLRLEHAERARQEPDVEVGAAVAPAVEVDARRRRRAPGSRARCGRQAAPNAPPAPGGRSPNESTCSRLASHTVPGRLPPTGGWSVKCSSARRRRWRRPRRCRTARRPASPRRGGSGMTRSPGSRREWLGDTRRSSYVTGTMVRSPQAPRGLDRRDVARGTAGDLDEWAEPHDELRPGGAERRQAAPPRSPPPRPGPRGASAGSRAARASSGQASRAESDRVMT